MCAGFCLLFAASSDVEGCAGSNPCANLDNSNHTCFDQPAALTGYECACDEGRQWNGTACACKSNSLTNRLHSHVSQHLLHVHDEQMPQIGYLLAMFHAATSCA
jgi:hypothetical protein